MAEMSPVKAALEEMMIIDTHEHIRPLKEVREGPWDFIELCKQSYVAADFASAGMTAADWPAAELEPDDRWAAFAPWVRRVENTAYYRSLLAGCRKLHGVPENDEMTAESFLALTPQMETARRRDDLIDWALGEVGRIEYALQDPHWDPFEMETDGQVLHSVLRINSFVVAPFEGQADHNEASPYDCAAKLGFAVNGFDSYLELIHKAVEHYKVAGAPAIKSSLAYDRSLDFAQVEKEDARRLYERGPEGLDGAEMKALEDFLMYEVIDAATEQNLPVQIHTGIRAGSGDVRGTNPMLLTELLLAHPQARFALFHGGYPHCSELTVLAKAMPNVWLDMCWLPIISPSVVRRMLQEWIEAVPMSKLMWGGDCAHVEAALGALEFGKDIVGKVMMAKVKEADYCTVEVAVRAAKCIMHDNAAALFFGEGAV
jgi:uncharacterized protein